MIPNVTELTAHNCLSCIHYYLPLHRTNHTLRTISYNVWPYIPYYFLHRPYNMIYPHTVQTIYPILFPTPYRPYTQYYFLHRTYNIIYPYTVQTIYSVLTVSPTPYRPYIILPSYFYITIQHKVGLLHHSLLNVIRSKINIAGCIWVDIVFMI